MKYGFTVIAEMPVKGEGIIELDNDDEGSALKEFIEILDKEYPNGYNLESFGRVDYIPNEAERSLN